MGSGERDEGEDRGWLEEGKAGMRRQRSGNRKKDRRQRKTVRGEGREGREKERTNDLKFHFITSVLRLNKQPSATRFLQR